MAEIVENYFEQWADSSETSNKEQTQRRHPGDGTAEERARTKPRMVNSTSLVFEDADLDIDRPISAVVLSTALERTTTGALPACC